MDAFARGLKIAHAVIADGRLDEFLARRYASFDSGIGARIEAGKMNFGQLEKFALKLRKSPMPASGRQEMLENLLNDFIR
jgi:xylose isomerase